MRATFRSGAGDLACRQFRLDRFRRATAAKRVCDCRCAHDASRLRAPVRAAHRFALRADHRPVLDPAVTRQRAMAVGGLPAPSRCPPKFLLRNDGIGNGAAVRGQTQVCRDIAQRCSFTSTRIKGSYLPHRRQQPPLREIHVQRVDVSRGGVANVHARAVRRVIAPRT